MAYAGSKTEMHWKPESDSAWREAKESGRPVLVEVWANWCEPCKRMDREVWTEARVIEGANKFVQISVDASRRDQTNLGGIVLGKTGVHMVKALPTVMVLDPWGETLAVWEGLVSPAEMLVGLAQVPADYSAVRVEREALLSHRDNSRALASVAMLYQRNSSFGIANRYFKEALAGSGAREDEAQRERLHFMIATNEVRLADWKAARKHLDEFRVSYPNSTRLDQVLFAFVVADVRQNKMKEARQHADELRSAYPNSKMIAEADQLLLEERGAKRH
jgi:thioredoxin-like negative regulator of GroEL